MAIISHIVFRKIFIILSFSTFVSALGMGIITPIIPIYAESLGASGAVLGFVFSSFPLARGIVVPLIGRASDRRGRKVFIVTGLVVFTTVSLGYVWASDTAQLIAVRIVHGAASGMIAPLAQAYLGETCPQDQVGRWMGYSNAIFATGFGCGPFLGGVISDHFGIDAAYYTMFGINAAALLAALLLPAEKKPRASQSTAGFSFREVSRSNAVRSLFSFRMAFDMLLTTLLTFLPLYAVLIGMTATETGILIAVIFLLMSSLQAITGRMADRMDRGRLVVASGIIVVTSVGLMPLAGSFWQLLPLAALAGIGGSLSVPATSAMAVEQGKKFGMGTSIAVVYFAMSVGAVIGPVSAGSIQTDLGLASTFFFAAGSLLVGTGMFHYFTGKATAAARVKALSGK